MVFWVANYLKPFRQVDDKIKRFLQK